MRTTLTLEDDLARALKERARRSGRSFKEVVNETLRRGLAAGEDPEAAAEPFVVEAAARGFRPGVDPRRLNQLLDELEVGGFGSGLATAGGRDGDGASRLREGAAGEGDEEDPPR